MSWRFVLAQPVRNPGTIVRDETAAVQLVNPAVRELDPEGVSVGAAEALALTEQISALSHGTFVTVTGELKHDERVKLGGLEVKIGSLDVVSEALETPIAADSSLPVTEVLA